MAINLKIAHLFMCLAAVHLKTHSGLFVSKLLNHWPFLHSSYSHLIICQQPNRGVHSKSLYKESLALIPTVETIHYQVLLTFHYFLICENSKELH